MTLTTIEVSGNLWVGDPSDPMDGPVQLESAQAQVVIERTDHDEVAIHATLPGDDNAVVTLFMNRVAAVAVSKLLEREALRDL